MSEAQIYGCKAVANWQAFIARLYTYLALLFSPQFLYYYPYFIVIVRFFNYFSRFRWYCALFQSFLREVWKFLLKITFLCLFLCFSLSTISAANLAFSRPLCQLRCKTQALRTNTKKCFSFTLSNTKNCFILVTLAIICYCYLSAPGFIIRSYDP